MRQTPEMKASDIGVNATGHNRIVMFLKKTSEAVAFVETSTRRPWASFYVVSAKQSPDPAGVTLMPIPDGIEADEFAAIEKATQRVLSAARLGVL